MRLIFFVISIFCVASCLNICAVNTYTMLGEEVKYAFAIKLSNSNIEIELLGEKYCYAIEHISIIVNDFILKTTSFLREIWENYFKTLLNELADYFSSVMLYLWQKLF